VGCGRALAPRVDDHTIRRIPMKSLTSKVQRFLASEDGPTAVEYAVMLALIVIVCLTAIQAIGTNANQTFQDIADQLD
jgi:pilus assembly protein Flp/PilA